MYFLSYLSLRTFVWTVGGEQEACGERRGKARGKIFACLFDVEGRKTVKLTTRVSIQPFHRFTFLKVVVG